MTDLRVWDGGGRYARGRPYSLQELWNEIGVENMKLFIAAEERNHVPTLVAVRNMLIRTGQAPL